MLGDSAGERAALVTEQLALKQRFAKCGAVDGDERPARPRAAGMNRSCHHFFSGAALTQQEHGRVGARHPPDKSKHVLHRRAFPDDAAGEGGKVVRTDRLSAEPFDMADVLQRNRPNPGNGG